MLFDHAPRIIIVKRCVFFTDGGGYDFEFVIAGFGDGVVNYHNIIIRDDI